MDNPTYVTRRPPFQACTAHQMKFSKDRWIKGMYAPRKPQVNRFCTVKPTCQVSPHQAMMQEKRQTTARETMMTAIAWPTERPWVNKVFGVCHVETFNAPL